MDVPVTGPAQIPATVEVICGTLRGTYDVAKTKILYLSHLGSIREATPTEFERLGGRQATKKWKQSIRVVDSHGQPGRSLGEWLAGTAGTSGDGQRQAFAWLTMGQRAGGWPEGGGDGARGGAAQSSNSQLREQFQLQLLDFLTGRIDNPGAGPGQPPEGGKFGPVAVGSHSFDLQKMYSTVREMGGYAAVVAMSGGWEKVAERLGLDKAVVNTPHACRSVYEHYLLRAERLEKAREAAGIPPQPPAPRGAPPGSPTASGPSMQTAGGGGAAAAVAATGPAAPAPQPLKHEPNPVDRPPATAAAAAVERSDRALAAAAAAQRAPPPPQQLQVDRQPGPAARKAAAAAAASPAGPQWMGAASGSRAGGAQLSGQYERRGMHIEEGGRSARDGPGGRGPYGSGAGRSAGGGGYDSGLSEGRGGYDNLEREEYDGPGGNEYDEQSRGGYDALPARIGYGGPPRSGGYDGGSGLHTLQVGGFEGGGTGGGRGGYDSGSRRSFDVGSRGGYEQGIRAGYSGAGGRGGYDGGGNSSSGGGGRGYSLANRFYDGPPVSGVSSGSGPRYRTEHTNMEHRLALEALLHSAHVPQFRSYENPYEQRSSLLPHDINDDQLIVAAGLGLQSAVGRDGGGGPGGGGGGPVVNPLHLDSPPVGRQQPGGLHFGRDGGVSRLQLQLGGGSGRQQQQQEAREAMLVTLAGGSGGGGAAALSGRGGLMQAIENAGLVSFAGGPVSTASRLLPMTRGGGGGADALHPGWLSRGGGRGGGGGAGGGMQLQGSRAAALLSLQEESSSHLSSLLSDYLGGVGVGGMPVELVRTGSGGIGISGLGLAGGGGGGLGAGGSGGGGGGYKRGQPDIGGSGGGDHGGGGGGMHKRQAL